MLLMPQQQTSFLTHHTSSNSQKQAGDESHSSPFDMKHILEIPSFIKKAHSNVSTPTSTKQDIIKLNELPVIRLQKALYEKRTLPDDPSPFNPSSQIKASPWIERPKGLNIIVNSSHQFRSISTSSDSSSIPMNHNSPNMTSPLKRSHHIMIDAASLPSYRNPPSAHSDSSPSSAISPSIHDSPTTPSPTRPKTRKFKCEYEGCGKYFLFRAHLVRHERMHTGERPFQCPHEGCSSTFSRYDNMMHHYRSHSKR